MFGRHSFLDICLAFTSNKGMGLCVVAAIAMASIAGCNNDANIVSQNLSTDADNFKVLRRTVFYNGITGEYILEVTGYCSLGNSDTAQRMTLTCKTPDGYKKHYLGLSNNVTFFSEQIDAVDVSSNFYKVVFKPTSIVPMPTLR